MNTNSTHKTFFQMEGALNDALCALQILHERLMDQIGVMPQPELTSEEANGTIYLANQALQHLQDALEPVPRAA